MKDNEKNNGVVSQANDPEYRIFLLNKKLSQLLEDFAKENNCNIVITTQTSAQFVVQEIQN